MEKAKQPRSQEELRKDFLASKDFLFWKGELEDTVKEIFGGYEMNREEVRKLKEAGVDLSTELDVGPVLMKKIVELASKNGYDETSARRFFWGLIGDGLKENVYKDIENKFVEFVMGGGNYEEAEKMIKDELLGTIIKLSPSVYAGRGKEGGIFAEAKTVFLDKFYEFNPEIKREIYSSAASGGKTRGNIIASAVRKKESDDVAAEGGVKLEDEPVGKKSEKFPQHVKDCTWNVPADISKVKPGTVFIIKNIKNHDRIIAVEIKEDVYIEMKSGDFYARVRIDNDPTDRFVALADFGLVAYRNAEHRGYWNGWNRPVNRLTVYKKREKGTEPPEQIG